MEEYELPPEPEMPSVEFVEEPRLIQVSEDDSLEAEIVEEEMIVSL